MPNPRKHYNQKAVDMSERDPLKNYAEALADLMTAYAKQLTAEAGNEATIDLLKRIGDGSERVVIVAQMVPFSVHACRLDDLGNADAELFKITDGGLH